MSRRNRNRIWQGYQTFGGVPGPRFDRPGDLTPRSRRALPGKPAAAPAEDGDTGAPAPACLFTVAVDTREQAPLTFGAWPTARLGLPTGDYSIVGCEARIAIERKSLPDLFACVGRERGRFERELARMAALEYAALVVEDPLEVLLAGHERSQVTGAAVVGSLCAWSVAYRLPVFAVAGRRLAAGVVLKLLSKWWKHAVGEPEGIKGWSSL